MHTDGGFIDFEISHFCNFRTSVTLTLALDWVTLHTVVYHSSTSTHTINFVQIEKHLWTDRRADIATVFINKGRQVECLIVNGKWLPIL